ncbi:hypothetical protein KNO15_09480 [Leifsonia shinshuensis]|uniref:hypothetical protein n=1 Tax=Leifsonia shinshuensis TaxID=150026 RepID=UPI001F50F96A|nr:hypothetical protein [Leifsonia shinshuensis]MCI0156923.1 hypothetical protein [Leifsonia shinshuensis]
MTEFTRRWVSGAAIGVVVAVAASAVPACADTPDDTLAVVAAATPETVADAASVPTTDIGENAIDATVAGANVTIPVDPAAGISLSGENGTVSIGLPFADQAAGATVQKPGVVSYDNGNGSSTVPVVQSDGSVQINTIVDNAAAPTRYSYPLDLPAGQGIYVNEDGSAHIADEAGTATGFIPAPWAKDAKGNDVPTRFEVSGNVLTQVIDFTDETAFPVVADPTVTFGTYVDITMSQATAKSINAGSAGTAIALLALAGPVGAIIGAAVYGTIGTYNDNRLNQCRNWKFSYTYLGQLVKAGCA